LDLQWDDRPQARYFRRLASFSRLIMLDKRGTGLSDRVGVATLEERMDDVRAVMDAAGSERAVIFGSSEGGALAILLSVTYPQRVSALVLYGAYAHGGLALGYPDEIPMEVVEEGAAQIESHWGRTDAANQLRHTLNPAQAADPRLPGGDGAL
jgi:pimeloyl-ACP methyl ester carboxylesterase